jgi:chorismate mutase
LRRRIPALPILCDPSHIGGKRELIAPLSQQAMDLSFDGLIIESHSNPDAAWSDKEQQITPDVLDYVLNLLVIRNEVQSTENLSELRRQIDAIDEQLLELLSKRMRISCEIGIYKKEHNMPVLQSPRYSEILEKRVSIGETMALHPDFIREILQAIHEESVRQQMIIMGNEK